MKILLVDDITKELKFYQGILESLGHEVVLEGSGYGAVRRVLYADPSFDAVITDMLMPNGTGLNLLQAISRHLDNPPPFLLHSAEPNHEDRSSGKVKLAELHETFDFMTFNLKSRGNAEETEKYFKEFLNIFVIKQQSKILF